MVLGGRDLSPAVEIHHWAGPGPPADTAPRVQQDAKAVTPRPSHVLAISSVRPAPANGALGTPMRT